MLEQVPGGLELVLDVAVADGIKDFLHETLLSQSLGFVDECLLLVVVLVLAGSLAPILPGCELEVGGLSLGLLNTVLESQEDSLLEPGLSDHLRKVLVAIDQVLPLAE